MLNLLHLFYCLIKLYSLRRFGFGKIRRFGNFRIRVQIFLQILQLHSRTAQSGFTLQRDKVCRQRFFRSVKKGSRTSGNKSSARPTERFSHRLGWTLGKRRARDDFGLRRNRRQKQGNDSRLQRQTGGRPCACRQSDYRSRQAQRFSI